MIAFNLTKNNQKQAISVLIVFVVFFLIPSCGKEVQHPVPHVQVNIQINVESPQFIELNPVHGWVSLTGGFAGIIIFRWSIDEFRAFDRACPHHPFDQCGRITSVDPPLATCQCCQSTFVLLDGSVFSGPSRFPLKQYRTSFQHPWLVVTN
ncbi:MAG TPA: hypothetical protein VLH61_07495 [Bacteroidales bacterium]|nr:hypothetical protein [Bacteroidales bacterium]